MSKFLNKNLSKLVPYTPGEQPKGVDKLIKLNTNESPFPPSTLVKKALHMHSADDLRLYPDPLCDELIEQFAVTYNVEKTKVTVGNGSDELLAFAFNAFCENGVAFSDITYGFYPVFASLYGVNASVVPLNDDFTIDINAYKKEKGTIIIANPNAPTGIELAQEKIIELLNQNKNRLVIVDEAYVDFGAQSAVSLLNQFDNLLIIGTFSKSRSLAGARIGYAIANSEIINDLNTIKFSFNPYNINRLSLLAGANSLKDNLYFKMCCKEIINTRQYTLNNLNDLGFTCTDSKANFLFVKPPEKLSAEQYYLKLRQNNILVRYFNAKRTSNYVRITIGTLDQMQTLIKATKKILN